MARRARQCGGGRRLSAVASPTRHLAQPPAAQSGHARLQLDTGASPPRLRLCGDWTQRDGLPDAAAIAAQLTPGSSLVVAGDEIGRWDTSLAAFVRALDQAVGAQGGTLQLSSLPAGLERLLRLVREKPAGAPQSSAAAPRSAPGRQIAHGLMAALASFGRPATRIGPRAAAWAELIGRIAAAFVRLVTARARVPWSDVLEQLVECGPRALPIVALLAFLIGGITAFVGVVQLRLFNAELYIADLVGMGMLLEMGALMTAVIMAGRAAASFAAALGTMQTNEEIDALTTLGLDPVEFLVLPRVLALAVCTPLLTLFADLIGIVGGGAVAVWMLDLAPATYFLRVADSVQLSDAVKGLIKALAFGLALGFAGCLRGIESGRSAQAVGRATTSAVVTSIVLLVLLDAFLTMLFFLYDGQL